MSGCSLSTAAPAIHRLLSTPIRPAAAAAPARLCHGLDGGGACLSFELVSRKPWKEVRRKQRCSPGSEVSCGFLAEPALEVGFVVVNFYKFVFIEDPGGEVTKHLAFLQGRDVHRRIYINEQGINAQWSCCRCMAYVEWLKEDDHLSDVLVQISPTLCGHAFPRLKLRCKPSLVQLEGGISHLPLLDPTMRATPLEPSKWRKKILCIPSFDDSLGCDQSKTDHNLLLLDVRNGYEWYIDHFDGAQEPNVDSFRVTSFGLMESEGRRGRS